MTRHKTSTKIPSIETTSSTKLDDVALQILLKEYDVLCELFTQAETGAQNIFNFYSCRASNEDITLMLSLIAFAAYTDGYQD